MQVTETEIILPLKVNSSLSSKDLLPLCLLGILMLGGGIYLFTQGSTAFSIVLIIFAMLLLLPSIMALNLLRQGHDPRASHMVRIDHEGVFFSHLFGVALFPSVVTWSEITTLVPYTWTSFGHSIIVLGFVLQDPEAVIARLLHERSRNMLSCFFANINLSFYRRAHIRTPLNIPAGILPISIDELIVLIQERFANELHEHGITILAWQH